MDIFQKGEVKAADEILSTEFAWHGGMGPPVSQCGPEGVKQVAGAIIAAFPDRQITHHDVIAEGDKVLVRWSMTGTQKGDLMGIPPPVSRSRSPGWTTSGLTRAR
jgi:predicted SnoaL-like aldol condensation-catalyzing enzyme